LDFVQAHFLGFYAAFLGVLLKQVVSAEAFATFYTFNHGLFEVANMS